MTSEGLIVTHQEFLKAMEALEWDAADVERDYIEGDLFDDLNKAGLLVVDKRKLLENAKTLAQLNQSCSLLPCKNCYAPCEFPDDVKYRGKFIRVPDELLEAKP